MVLYVQFTWKAKYAGPFYKFLVTKHNIHFILYSSVYSDGRVCISILHAPGDDPMGYETSAERWSPVQSVEKILLSVVSMLAGEEISSHHWRGI